VRINWQNLEDYQDAVRNVEEYEGYLEPNESIDDRIKKV